MPTRAAALLLAACVTAVPSIAYAESPAKSYLYGERNFRRTCRPPLKYAAGACVRSCPAGFQDLGRYCRMRTNTF